MSTPAHPTVVHAFAERLAADPDATFVDVIEAPKEEFALSYADLHHAARCVANGFRERGIGARDRIIVALPTSRDFFAVYLAALYTGVIPLVIPGPRPNRPVEHYVEQLNALSRAIGASAIVVHESTRPELVALFPITPVSVAALSRGGPLARLEPAAGAGDIAHLQATSGSTGQPKLAIIRHANIVANVQAIGTAIRHRASDILLTWLPFYHDMGLIGISYALHWRCKLVAADPANFVRKPIAWLQWISRFRATLSPAPNSAFHICARLARLRPPEQVELSSWRVALCGAEPIHEETIRQFQAAFGPLGFRSETMLPVYGLAEATLAAAIPDVDAPPLIESVDADALASDGRGVPAAPGAARSLRLVSVGPAVPGHELRIVDSQGFPVAERVIGEIEFAGPSIVDGYWGERQAGADLKRPDGFLRTGDLGYLADGQLYITGRQKEIIIVNGRNYIPTQIESLVETILESEIAHGVVAVGLTDPRLQTENLHLLIDSRLVQPHDQQATEERIANALEEVFGLTGITTHWIAKGQIPKTTSGKIQRHLCRALIQS